MQTVFQAKEQTITDAPLLLFDCVLSSGSTEHWCTHAIAASGNSYAPRLLRHNVFEMQVSSDQGVDSIPRISLDLANADSHFSEIERTIGFKGSQLTVTLLFYDLRSNEATTDPVVLFKGLAGSPELITESTFRVSAINRLSMQRVVLPQVRIQRRCPWEFPTNASQRQEAVQGGPAGIYSRYYRCGYSADQPGGVGNLNNGQPFTSCTYTRADCTARGMFNIDNAVPSNQTRRFGGIEFVPSTIAVRSTGEKGTHLSPVSDNEARYNDFVPLIYGRVWHSPEVVFARNDGNLTRMEVLLGMGQIQDVVKVLVNDIEIPLGQNGLNMTGTGWFNVIGLGTRGGAFNPDFTDSHGNFLGDPYGSMAYLSVVVPNKINDGNSLPSVKVLLDGLLVGQYGTDGSSLGASFSNNPAWVILDLLQRSGWNASEMDLPSFAAAAAYCQASIQTEDLNGNQVTIPRFQCNLVIRNRRSAGDVVRGIRTASRLYLGYDLNGLLQLRVENTFALQQPQLPAGSNATMTLNGGWPAYEFGDGSGGVSGILRNSDSSSSVKLTSRNAADAPNRFSAEFQDAFNDYQQDSYSVVDVADVAKTGQEINATFTVLGLPNYDQAARILQFALNKSTLGNTVIEFQTSVKAIGLSPGDLITVTYLKEGFERQPFRIVKVAPSTNYRSTTITAQIHDDAWYADSNGQTSGNSGARRQPLFGIGLPRPITGTSLDINGDLQFGVVESTTQTQDGTTTLFANVAFVTPAGVPHSAPDIPLVGLDAIVSGSGGTLATGQTLYYAISAVDAAGEESAMSFVVRATLASDTDTNSVTLEGLSFDSRAVVFNVYRGGNPSDMLRVASNLTLAAEFTDAGVPPQPLLPPDPNFDHVNFYWRLELEPEASATIQSTNSIGNGALRMITNEYQTAVVRITRGTGAAQERTIISNTDTTVTVDQAWDVTPDTTSYFVVAQSGYQFGSTGTTSPIQFSIPNRQGAIVHISGRSANANGFECPYEISPLTRWTVGGSGIKLVDASTAPTPVYGLDVPASPGGTVVIGSIGFPDTTNTTSVTAGTCTLYYVDEMAGLTTQSLAGAIGPGDSAINLLQTQTGDPPMWVQVEKELMLVTGMNGGGTAYQVSRGVLGTTAAQHSAGALVSSVLTRVAVIPFVRNFFGSPASGSWSYPLPFPNVRIVASELFVTNSQGNSPTATIPFTNQLDYGMRTLSGGQYSFQVAGFLAIQTGAAPDIVVDAPHVVRDVYAVLNVAATGSSVGVSVYLNQQLYCSVTIPAGSLTSSTLVDGALLPPMNPSDRLSLNITGVGSSTPGSDLTVVIRV